jgi:hypothetical protein
MQEIKMTINGETVYCIAFDNKHDFDCAMHSLSGKSKVEDPIQEALIELCRKRKANDIADGRERANVSFERQGLLHTLARRKSLSHLGTYGEVRVMVQRLISKLIDNELAGITYEDMFEKKYYCHIKNEFFEDGGAQIETTPEEAPQTSNPSAPESPESVEMEKDDTTYEEDQGEVYWGLEEGEANLPADVLAERKAFLLGK